MTLQEGNWLNGLTLGIVEFQQKLEDAQTQIGKNPKVKEEYDMAMKKIAEAREAVHRFAAVFNQEYRRQGSE